MRIEKENQKNPKSEIRNPKYLGRCFLRIIPPKAGLPGQKLGFPNKKKEQRGKANNSVDRIG
jgi:hypothetical protein